MKSLESKIRDILLEKNKENLKKKKEVIPPKERKKEELSDFDPRVHLKKEETNLNEGIADTASAAGSKGLQKTRDGILKSMKPQGGSDMTVQMPVPKPLLSPHTMLKHPSFVMNPHLYLPKEKPGPEAKKSVSSAKDVGNKSSKLASAAGGGKNSATTKKKVAEAVDVKDKPTTKVDVKTEPKPNLPVVYEPKNVTTTSKTSKTLTKTATPVLKRAAPLLTTILTVLNPTPLNKGENELERQKKYSQQVPVKLPTIEVPATTKAPTVPKPAEQPKVAPAPASSITKQPSQPPVPPATTSATPKKIPAIVPGLPAAIPDAYKEHGAGKYIKPRLKVHKAKMHVKEDREDIDAVARKNRDRKNLEYVGRKDKKALTRQSEIVRKIDENSTRAATLVKKITKERKYNGETKRYGETVVNPELNNTPLDMREGVVSKLASKLTPGVGAAYGAMSAAEKIKQKDYPGAALAAASAAPVIGWPAVALDIARDYAKSGESGTTPMIKHPQTKGVETSKVFDRMRKTQIKEEPRFPIPSTGILNTIQKATKLGLKGAVAAGLMYGATKVAPTGASHLATDIKKFSVGRKALDVGSKASDYADNKVKEISSDDRVKKATDYIKSKITKD